MIFNEQNDTCYHCGQLLTEEAKEHIERTGGLLPKTPEQKEAERIAEEERIQTAISEGVAAKLKETEKSPQEKEAEEKEIANTISTAEKSGFKNGVQSMQEQLNIKNKENADQEEQINELRALLLSKSNTKSVSGELMGNLQDKTLFDILVDLYPGDKFKDFGVGEPGADILQTVFHNGKQCGTITWESKRMEPNKSFKQTEWIKKLLEDKLENKSSVAVFVANKFPKKDRQSGIELDYPNSRCIKEFGYWYCSTIPHEINMLSFGLRQQVIVQASSLIDKDQLSINEEIINFVCGEQAKSISDKIALHNSKADDSRIKILELQKTNIKNAVATIDTLNKYDMENQDVLNLQTVLVNKIHKIAGQSGNLIENTGRKEPLKLDNPLKPLKSVK